VVLRIIPAQAEWSVFVYNEVKMAKNEEKGEIVLYQPEGEVRLEVRVEKESVWLSQMQMADLFQKDRTAIGRHIKNIYKEGELAKDITCANFARVGVDADQTYKLPMKGR
jgi:Virulence protein